MIFLDTSVLVAVAQTKHTHHTPSLALWNRCTAQQVAVSTHALAEVYHVLTAMPPGLRVTPRDAVLVIETFLKRLRPASLPLKDYLEALRNTANLGLSGGVIYDALHLACAREVKAEKIYTWNVRHFQMVAPDLADRIMTP